jgi:hypothetical protein
MADYCQCIFPLETALFSSSFDHTLARSVTIVIIEGRTQFAMFAHCASQSASRNPELRRTVDATAARKTSSRPHTVTFSLARVIPV